MIRPTMVVVVKAGAAKAVPGITLTKAEKETKGDVSVYELDGTANGKSYEIKLKPDGSLVKVKEEKAKTAGAGGKEDDDDDEDDDD